MQISYRSIFKTAWQITAKNKILWIFGFFSSFLSLESVYDTIIYQIQQTRNLNVLPQKLINLSNNQVNFLSQQIYFFNLLSEDYFAFLVFILFVIIVVLFIWLILTSQIYLIKSVASLYKNKKIKKREVFAQSNEKFWHVLLINFLSKLALYVGFLALNLPLFYLFVTKKNQINLSVLIFLFVIYIVFAIIINFITAYSTNYIVLKNLFVLEAISESWRLFSRNIALSLEIAFLLFFLKIASLILMLSCFFLILIPLGIILFISMVKYSFFGLVFSLTLAFLSFLILSLLFTSIFTVFYISSWTITFIQLTEKKPISKIIHFIKKIFLKKLKNKKVFKKKNS